MLKPILIVEDCVMPSLGDARWLACAQTWEELYAGMFMVDIEGWGITIFNDCDEPNYCEECVSTDGRRWSFDSGDRFGRDPIALLSTWKHKTLSRC
ncbi:DUF7693 family protein [Pseudomonas serbica]